VSLNVAAGHLPGIGFEGKSDLFAEMKALAALSPEGA
jgi:hypothetical protein